MSKRHLTFVCQNCGAAHGRWQGKCEACGEWNTMVEEGADTGVGARPAASGRAPRKGRTFTLEPMAGEAHEAPRLPSGLSELDRVLSGGLVAGSVTLLAGEPWPQTLLGNAAARAER